MTNLTKKLSFNFNGADTSYLTHSLHPYPAKFPPQLPQTILNQFSKKGETVLDPFCGSGTTLIEARIFGVNAVGVDVNGLSVLLSKVKATPLTDEQFRQIQQFIEEVEEEVFKWKFGNRPKIQTKEIEGQVMLFIPVFSHRLLLHSELVREYLI